MSERSRLPVWTPVHTGEDRFYEAVDSRGHAWRMWLVAEDAPGDPFPSGWRFAPVGALEQANFIERVGGLRELDIAAMRIDAGAVVGDKEFRHRMGLDDPRP